MRIISLAIVLPFIISSVGAIHPGGSQGEHRPQLIKRLAIPETIHLDTRPQPQPPFYNAILAAREVRRNADSTTVTASASSTPTDQGSSTTASPSMTSGSSSNSTSSGGSSSSSSTTSSVVVVSTTLPSPFDTSLGSNYTETSCPAFFKSFLSNTTFISCHPVSLLLQNSLGFFQASRSPALLEATLNAACSASLAICSPLMSNLASALIADSNCGADYKRDNPVVTQAYAGLMAYEPIYNATCLQDAATGNYCYSEAVINSTNPSDTYPYYTALGIPLPNAAQPTCSTCLQQTMSMFAGYAKKKDQPLSRTYLGCANQVDSSCGSSFANTQVQVGTVSSNDAFSAVRMSLSLRLAAMVLLIWQLL